MNKWAIYAGVLVLGLIGAGWLLDSAAGRITGMVVAAASSARDERDLLWRSQVAELNAEVDRMRLAKLEQAVSIDKAAREQITDLEQKVVELEKANADLPDANACGLGRARVQLLDK